MPVKINLYYDQNKRELVVDYNLKERVVNIGFVLISTSMDANEAREFIDYIEALYPNMKNTKYMPVTVTDIVKGYLTLYPFMYRVKKIHVVDPMPFIFIEQNIGDIIIKGSRLFCGQCGENIGVLDKLMTYPFNLADFSFYTANQKYIIDSQGTIRCGHCKKITGNYIDFILVPMREYFEKIYKTKNKFI
jgi:hypothetical protein